MFPYPFHVSNVSGNIKVKRLIPKALKVLVKAEGIQGLYELLVA